MGILIFVLFCFSIDGKEKWRDLIYILRSIWLFWEWIGSNRNGIKVSIRINVSFYPSIPFFFFFFFFLFLYMNRIWAEFRSPASQLSYHESNTNITPFFFPLTFLVAEKKSRAGWISHSFYLTKLPLLRGFPGGTSGKEPSCQCRKCKRLGFDFWIGKIPWRRAQQPTPVFLPGESHRQRSLAGCSPEGCKELGKTEAT